MAELVQRIGELLTTSLNPPTQKASEEALLSLSNTNPDFVPAILAILDGSVGGVQPHIRTAAAVLFKNFVKNNWPNDFAQSLRPETRQSIKSTIIERMVGVGIPAIQVQLAEAIVQIAAVDFPESWPDLIAKLSGCLTPSDHGKNLAILRTLHYIFKRYRSEGRTDELFTEINFVMSQFASVLLSLYRSYEGMIGQTGDKETLSMIVQSQTLCNKIFLSLSSQDLPAFFEDHLREFMDVFKKLFVCSSPLLATSDDEEEGPVERLITSVADIVSLYASKYEEDFPMLPEFVELSWMVLTTNIQTQPKYDRPASSTMVFLSTVAKQDSHKALFSPVLQLICDKIILPNMILRDSDLELFEDDPLEFIRRDQQESTTSSLEAISRRGAAVALTRGLMELFESDITTILGNYIQQYMELYLSAPSGKWREKNVATQLFSAIAVKGSVAQLGVTRVNAMVNIDDFFLKYIQQDLLPANAALHPILKIDAIKFVHQFRGQLTKEQHAAVLPYLMHHLSSHNHVVHTYAAMAIERILAIKGPNGAALFSSADLSMIIEPLCSNLLKLIVGKKTPEKMAENDLLMKALMRALLLAQSELITPMASMLVENLSGILLAVSKNPSNPRFNHFLFEAIMTVIRYGCPNEAFCGLVESKFLPIFQEILAADLVEFIPYLLQLYSGLVEFRPASQPGLPQYGQEMLAAVLQPPLWTTQANVPALVRYIQACLKRDSGFFVQSQALPSFFGIFQTLLGSRVNDLHAFTLLNTAVTFLPQAQLESYIQPAIVLLLKKLQAMKIAKISSSLLLTLCHMNLRFAPGTVFAAFESIQPKMIVGLMRTVLLVEATKIRENNDRSTCVLGLAKFLSATPALLTASQSDQDYSGLMTAILSTSLSVIANIQQQQPEESGEVQLYDSEESMAAFGTSSFARLQVLPALPRFPLQTGVNVPQELATAVVSAKNSLPSGFLANLCSNGLDVNQRSVLQTLLQQSSLSI